MAKDCFVSGSCVDSTLVAVTEPMDSRICLEDCQNQEGCNWFTYSDRLHFCELFNDCKSLDQDCSDCVSGEVSCPPYQCDIEGICLVNILFLILAEKQN
jgi:hypothetical protein